MDVCAMKSSLKYFVNISLLSIQHKLIEKMHLFIQYLLIWLCLD